ncbi:hypothetical protein BgAZ_107630 [Babesia gibsoni]|uniref:Uncharacterized protein n=1 Tax=Babesia gibsoni TaxID=33632 RepID=A0AAD8PGI3_BABGI|nr:hypothetical protein BgAZ_107630 [Babesia gibsoni]
MPVAKLDEGFGKALDSIRMDVDLESRGCHLVSRLGSISSETEHMNMINKLKSLLDTPAGEAPGSAGLKDGGDYAPYKDGITSNVLDVPGTLDKVGSEYINVHSAHYRDGKADSPRGSVKSGVSELSGRTSKRTDRETVLKHAEAVIEYQRERINSLEEAINKFNTAMNKTNNLYTQEIQQLGEENLELRKELQKVVTDFDVLSKRYSFDLTESEAIKKKINLINHDMIKKDDEILQLKERMLHLPRENEQLKEKNLLMANEIERLNREIKGLKFTDVAKPVKATVSEMTATTKACAAQHDKLKASSRCIAQLENDVQCYKRLSESQSLEIKRLNYKLGQLRNATQPNNYLASSQKQMLQIRSIFTQLVKKAEEPRKVVVESHVDEEVKNIPLRTAQTLKTSVEFREMYDKLLDVVTQSITRNINEDGIYSMMVDYSCGVIDQELKMRVGESIVTFYRVEEDRLEEVLRIPLNSVLDVERSEDTNEISIHTKDSEVHVIHVPNKDKFSRLYYALRYAGFIKENMRFSIFSKVDYDFVPEGFTWPPFTAVVTTAEANYKPQALNNYEDVRRVIGEIYVITDPAQRLLTIDNNTNSLVVIGPQMSSTPLVIHCESAFAVRLCRHLHEECEIFEPVEPPTATITNGLPADSYFMDSDHTFSFVLPNNRLLFVNAFDRDNDRRLLKIVRKGNYRVPGTPLLSPPMQSSIEEVAKFPHLASVESMHALPTAPLDELKNKFKTLKSQALEQMPSKAYEFVGDELWLYLKEETPVKVSNKTGHFRVNEEKTEVAITSASDETYVLDFPSYQDLMSFVKELESHGFNFNLEEETSKQVCIVTTGCLKLFRDVNEEPMITFIKEETKVEIDDSKREIQISQSAGKMIKMTLDCTSPGEFQRWKFALSFAGFIKSSMKTSPRNAVNKFIFPIKIFDNDRCDERRAFQVQPLRIFLYVNPTTPDPFLIFEKSSTSIESFDTERRMRIYVNRNTNMEERFDFVLAMLTDYDELKASLKANMYRIDNLKKQKAPKYHFVISKPGVIQVHRTKYDKDPQLLLDRKIYDANVSQMCIQFASRVDNKGTITMAFKKEFNFKRWLIALKVAGFLPLTNDRVPILYLPNIVYGHVCVEVPALLKGHLS